VVAAAYLLATGRAESVEAAVETLCAARPTIVIRPNAMRAIGAYFAGTTVRAGSVTN
jgi:hypothetical protein